MSEPYVAQIILFPYTFAPRNWAFCEGQLVAIAQNQALFSLIGTTYGGNGTTNFALPNFKDRSAIGAGQGPGLTNYTLGETVGTDMVTLNVQQIPSHNHTVFTHTVNDKANLTLKPAPGVFMNVKTEGGRVFGAAPKPGVSLSGNALGITGGSQAHNNDQPYLGLHYSIALYGVFPSRN
jgi:microcystin-dependent protein